MTDTPTNQEILARIEKLEEALQHKTPGTSNTAIVTVGVVGCVALWVILNITTIYLS